MILNIHILSFYILQDYKNIYLPVTLNCTGICLDDVPFITSCLKINKLKATFINPSPRTTLFRGHFYHPFSKDHPVYRSLLSPLPRTTLFTGHFYQPLTKDHPVYRPFLSTPHQGPPCLQPLVYRPHLSTLTKDHPV